MKYLWLFAFVTVMLGCNEVVPGTCRPNTTGGAGGADSWAVGAGVGVSSTTGTYGADPPMDPLAAGDGDSACSDPCEECPNMFPGNAYINCRARGLNASACSEVCMDAGALCVPFANHPYKSGLQPGNLTNCKNGWPSYTCIYTFANGDACYLVTGFGSPLIWKCIYQGG